jgi:hypothetical protein
MTEKKMQIELHRLLKDKFTDYTVSAGENLLYHLTLDSNQDIQPSKYKKPSRGQYAFQTDILVKKENTPLVVLELKWNGVSTHNIQVYSTKALKHKDVFPHLRYGLVVGGKQDVLDWKLFVHNKGFDFSYASKNVKNDIDEIVQIVRSQIRNAESILKNLDRKKKRPQGFSNNIHYYPSDTG